MTNYDCIMSMKYEVYWVCKNIISISNLTYILQNLHQFIKMEDLEKNKVTPRRRYLETSV